MHPYDSRPPAEAVVASTVASTPSSALAALHQREIAVLGHLERLQARLAERIREQLRRVRQAERLFTGEGQQ